MQNIGTRKLIDDAFDEDIFVIVSPTVEAPNAREIDNVDDYSRYARLWLKANDAWAIISGKHCENITVGKSYRSLSSTDRAIVKLVPHEDNIERKEKSMVSIANFVLEKEQKHKNLSSSQMFILVKEKFEKKFEVSLI